MVDYWTTRAHSDFFARNILTLYGYGGDSAEARAYNEFVSNAAPVTWPTLDELQVWVQSTTYQGAAGGDTTHVELLQLALDVAVSRIAQRTGNYVRPVDANGDVDPTGAPVEILPELKLAAIMQAFKWYERRSSPNGVLGATEFGGVIRAKSLDPDVEAMIGNELQFGLA